jgi:DNA-binding HxlR family transcriptional regulator
MQVMSAMVTCRMQVNSCYDRLMSRTTATRAGPRRSSCPINATLEVLGDRWSLLIVRDLMFAGFRSYKEFLSSDEGIATNVLAERLDQLEASGIVTRRRDPTDGRRLVYRLTSKGIDLAPVLLELSSWGAKHEGGMGPAASMVRRWKTDREGFLSDIREQWMKDEQRGRGR